MDADVRGWLHKSLMQAEIKTLLDDVTQQGAGSAVDVSGLIRLQAQLAGIGTATVKVEATIDGTNYVDVSGGGKTADSLFALSNQGPFKNVRGNVSAYTSGTITLKLIGKRV